jgi:hypothetical protein
LGERQTTRDGYGVARFEADLLRVEPLANRMQGLQRFRIALNHQDALGAARGGLKAKRPGTGKEI